jgi:hypothetical protein
MKAIKRTGRASKLINIDNNTEQKETWRVTKSVHSMIREGCKNLSRLVVMETEILTWRLIFVGPQYGMCLVDFNDVSEEC